MTLAAIVLSAVAVLPADRLSMADRLFNRGEYAVARGEYAALVGEKATGIARDELLYRLAECDRALGRSADARKEYGELLSSCPASRHADRSRLMRALSGTDDEKRVELKVLDSDHVEAEIRSAALYHLGVLNSDAAMLERSIAADPKGRYAAYANFHRASILAKSPDPAARRKASEILLTIAFGKDSEFADEALYLAAFQSYSSKRYGESASLAHRYLKVNPNGKRVAEVRTMAAWSDFLVGKYGAALSVCGEGGTDDFDYLLASCAAATGEGERARSLFAKYLEAHPRGNYRQSAELHLARMGFDAAEKSGDSAGRLENAKRAYALSKTSGDALRLAWAYEKSGDAARAREQYLAVARDFPGTDDGAEALFRKAMADLKAENWSAADISLAEAIASGRNEKRMPVAKYWRAVAAMRLGHEAEGAALLREALKGGIDIDMAREARLMLADVDFNAGRVDAAKAEYSKLVLEGACDRMSAAKTLKVGKLLEGEAALACAKALVKSDSAEWRQAGYALMGTAEEKSGAFTAAISAYRRAMAEKAEVEDIAGAALRLGVLESRAGEHDAADATLRKAVELNASDSRARCAAYLALAKNCEARGDAKGACAYATVVVSLFQKDENAAEAERILRSHPEAAK